MSANTAALNHPSPLPSSTTAESPRSRNSIEAFPDFPSSSPAQYSPGSAQNTQSNSYLDVPGAQAQPQRPNRLLRSASQRLPPTALFPAGRNVSHNDIVSPSADNNRDRDEQPQQKLPRAAPAPSLSGPPMRPSVAPALGRGSVNRVQPNAEELKSESLWADMQRTLADIELSAMKSSHLFNAPHSQALEKLRETQVALAQAWARSEADETVGKESEDEFLDSEAEQEIMPSTLASKTGGPEGHHGPKGKPGPKSSPKRVRQGSGGSNIGRDLEQETERDIKLARKRREANDSYFSQVNRGVLDVVARLDEVASVMRTVEQESRAVWEEMEASGSTTASGTELDNDTDPDEYKMSPLARNMTIAEDVASVRSTATSDSHVDPKTPVRNLHKNEKPNDGQRPSKDKGR